MTDTDTAFLRQIFDECQDDSVKLVYADWLEEQGDERGELVRLRCELAALPPAHRRAGRLRRKDRVLARRCDQRWLVLLERADWKKRYLTLVRAKAGRARWDDAAQERIGRALGEFEGEIGGQLPRSYKAYAHVFGPGEMGGYFRIYVPCVPPRLRSGYDLAVEHKQYRQFVESMGWFDEAERKWLKRAVLLAHTIGGEAVWWDRRVVSDRAACEYRVCWVDRSERVRRVADSFTEFIDGVCLSLFDDARGFLPYC